jgi:SAM-dependent methyltransferase
MLDLARVAPGGRVLDVAAGAGEPAITIADRVGPTGYVLATDISSNILDFAARSARERGLHNVETRVMDGEHLELPDESFDVVTSRVELIYFPDQQRALSEMKRVLKPGGRVAAIVCTQPQKTTVSSRFRSPSSAAAPSYRSRYPASRAHSAWARRVCSKTRCSKPGFRDVLTRVVAAPLRMDSSAECVRFERESFGALHQMLAGLSSTEREATWDEIHRELSQYEGPHGFEAPCELIVAVAVK